MGTGAQRATAGLRTVAGTFCWLHREQHAVPAGHTAFLMLILLTLTFPLRQHFSRIRSYLLLSLLCCGGLDGEH